MFISLWLSSFLFLLSCTSKNKENKGQYYSISQITADNYDDLLTLNDTVSINKKTDLSFFVEWPAIYFDASTIQSISGWEIRRGNIDDTYTIFINPKNNNKYYFGFDRANPKIVTKFDVICDPSHDQTKEVYLKNKIDIALKKEGFTYKESDRKRAPDILIKELKKDFIIGMVFLDDYNNPFAIHFQLYKREPKNN